ncbi:LexA family transcriptional regulator [Chromobacterium violaceum]|uniref:XRE family transcriptional regulator n=1 Tax=Chromobacterium violaceum TaxID=536 RepID=UPI001B339F89|nr:LexA family transcriptional regulator [Chromobacterium violaceum]MBP4048997.1 LexA family transcriptional regulator [Chromobacterium violaceum]
MTIAYGKRIEVLRKAKGWRQEDFAEQCGWGSASRIGNYEREDREPSLRDFETMAEVLGVTTPYLIFGDEATTQAANVVVYGQHDTNTANHVLIENYHIQPAASSGAVSWEKSTQDALLFPQSFFEARELNPQHLKALQVNGTNMQPHLRLGDTVLIDSSDTTPRHGEIYVVAFGDEWFIKRVFKTPTNLLLVSDNEGEPDVPISHDELYAIKFYGRVVWRGG